MSIVKRTFTRDIIGATPPDIYDTIILTLSCYHTFIVSTKYFTKIKDGKFECTECTSKTSSKVSLLEGVVGESDL